MFLSEEDDVLNSVATDLKSVPYNSSAWIPTLEKYLERHKSALTDFLSEGYTEDGEIWTYSGSFLICVSIINIFGKYALLLSLFLMNSHYNYNFVIIEFFFKLYIFLFLLLVWGVKCHVLALNGAVFTRTLNISL